MKRILILLAAVLIGVSVKAQTQVVEAKQLKAVDSFKLKTNWIKSIITDTAITGATSRDIASAAAIKTYIANRMAHVVKYGDTSALLAGYIRELRFLDSLSAVQTRIQTKLTKSDADTYYPDVQRMIDSLSAVQARLQTKEPLLGFTPVPNTRTVNGHALSADVTLSKSDVGLGSVSNVDATNAANISSGTLPDARLSGNVTLKGNSFNGADQLVKTDAAGKLPSGVLPALAITETFTVASQAAMLALSAQQGDVAIRSDEQKTYILTAEPASTLANWVWMQFPDAENDPIFTSHSAYSITSINISNWNTAFSWGNHAGLYRPVSWVPSWGDITGSVPVWNQNTTGTAASLSAVLSSSLGGAGSVNGILKANGSGVVSAAVAGTDYAPAVAGGYLPLSGGTLTGGLSGTTVSMSGNINQSGTYPLNIAPMGGTYYSQGLYFSTDMSSANHGIRIGGRYFGSGDTRLVVEVSDGTQGYGLYPTALAYTEVMNLSRAGNVVYKGSLTSGGGVYAKDIVRLYSNAYPSSFATSIGANTSAIGHLQLGNNGQNYIVAGSASAGGYLDFYVNNTSTLPTSPNGTLSVRLNSNGTSNFYGAAYFGSTVSAFSGSVISGAANNSWALIVENSGTTSAHGLHVNLGASSTGIAFRIDKNSVEKLSVTSAGELTIASSIVAGGNIAAGGTVFATSDQRTYLTAGSVRVTNSNLCIDFGIDATSGYLGTNYYSGGSYKKLVLYAGGTTNQLTLNTDGTIVAGYAMSAPSLYLTASTASTSTTTGALVVTGGVGVGGAVYAGGDVVAYSTSDRRLKDNIRPIENALYKVGQLSGNEFDWNSRQQSTYSGHDYGVIAQEVEKVLPYAVTIRENGFYGVKYERIIPLLIESIKELKKEIDLLKIK